MRVLSFAMALVLHGTILSILAWRPLLGTRQHALPDPAMVHEEAQEPAVELVELEAVEPLPRILDARESTLASTAQQGEGAVTFVPAPTVEQKNSGAASDAGVDLQKRRARMPRDSHRVAAQVASLSREPVHAADDSARRSDGDDGTLPESEASSKRESRIGDGQVAGVGVASQSHPPAAIEGVGKGGNPSAQRVSVSTRARPAYGKNPTTPYPLLARRRGQEGTVLLFVEVGANGRAIRVSLKTSSGFAALDEAARAAVASWRFEPARVDGRPSAAKIEVPVRFSLRN
jgi:TonB family protein